MDADFGVRGHVRAFGRDDMSSRPKAALPRGRDTPKLMRPPQGRRFVNASRFRALLPGRVSGRGTAPAVPTRLDSAGRNGIGAANKERWQADAGILAAGHARARSIAKGFCDEQATPPAAKRTSQVATFIYLRLLMSKNQHGRGHPGAGPPGRNPPHS